MTLSLIMLSRLKTEFRAENFKITFANHQNFLICRWQKTEQVLLWFLIYRLIYFLLVLLVICYYMMVPCFQIKSLLYITIWSSFMWLSQVTLGLVCVTVGYIDQNYYSLFIRRPMLYGFYWVLYCTYMDLCYGVTIFYWALIHFDGNSHRLNFINIVLHGFNSIIPIVDMFIVAIPVRLLHVYTSFGHTGFYIIVNCLYCILGGTDQMEHDYIHVALDWNNNLTNALLTAFAFFPSILIFRIINFYIYLLRTKLYLSRQYRLQNNVND